MKFRRTIFLIYTIISQLVAGSLFAQSNPVEVVPFILNNGHIIIRITLDGSDELNFLFDSGAGGTLIVKEVADSLGFSSTQSRKNIGVAGSHKVGVIKGIKLGLSGLELGNITLLSAESSLEQLDDGRKVHGVIGYPILSRYVVSIDYASSELKLYNSHTFSYTGKGKSLPIKLTLNLPIARARAIMYNENAFEGNFLVDTGARSDLIISSPTVIEHDMAENIGNHYTVRATIGSSQRKSKIRYGRLKSFQFGEYRFENLPIALSSDNKGLLADPNIDGIIGNRLLQRFNVVFDYDREVVYLEPSIYIGNDHIVNSSGFNIHFIDGKPFIKNVVDQSAGDRAGIRNGDELVSINGILVENITSKEVRDFFVGDGKKVELVIKRNNKFKYTELRLKPLI